MDNRLRQPVNVFRPHPACRAGDRDARNRLLMHIEHRAGDAAHPEVLFLTVNRIAPRPDCLKVGQQGCAVGQRVRGKGLARCGQDRIALTGRHMRQERLADPRGMHRGQRPGCKEGADRRRGFHLAEEQHLAVTRSTQIGRLSCGHHQLAQDRPGAVNERRPPQKPRPDDIGLGPDVPQLLGRIEFHQPAPFQRDQDPVHRRRGLPHLLRDTGQRTALGLAKVFKNLHRPIQ